MHAFAQKYAVLKRKETFNQSLVKMFKKLHALLIFIQKMTLNVQKVL